MASMSLPGILGWGNPASRLPGVLRSSLYHGGGLRAPFFFGRAVAALAVHTRLPVWTAPLVPPLLQRDVPAPCRFRVRPQLLTRCSAPRSPGNP